MFERIEARGNFINGQWRKVEAPDGEFTRENPARLSQTVFQARWSVASVDQAVQAARDAQPGWDRLGVAGRLSLMQSFGQALSARESDLARAISLEMGKPLWEATGEARALVAKLNIMSEEGLMHTAEVHPAGLTGGHYRARPLGVLAVLGPFNFPLHLPNGHIIPGLLTGNTVVVKPSEFTGGSMQLYFECAQAAGFPAGVLNLVQGPGPVGAGLSGHQDVDGVLFTGSYDTGLKIKRATLEHHWKLLALEMGGKNTSIVLEDANLEQAVHEITQAACLTTGQRCSATSRVIVRREIADAFIQEFSDTVSRVTTGDPLKEEVFMGPLASKASFDKFMQAQEQDDGGNLEPILRGGPARADLDGYFVTPAIWRANSIDARGPHQSCEIFGPDIIIYTVDSDTEAISAANATDFGLAMSVFTSEEPRFEDIAMELGTGILNMNRSTVGASSRLPFGGIKKSGNHRPAAILAGLYCTYPQAQLRQAAAWSEDALSAGPLSFLKRSK